MYVVQFIMDAQNQQAVHEALTTGSKRRAPAPSLVRESPRKKQRSSKAWGAGDRIQAVFQAYKLGAGAKYPGVIAKKNSNGSYVVHYADGDIEKNVLEKNISPVFSNMDEPYDME